MQRHWMPVALVAAAILLQLPTYAWNGKGHMTVAAIAYQDLDANSRLAVVKILKKHPHYNSMWKPGIPSDPGAAAEYLFLKAATWPDDIRGNETYDRPDWHYINKPFVPPGQNVPTAEPLPINILTALQENADKLLDPHSTAKQKAVALCWIFHLLGDVHQPLHTISLFTADYPLETFPQGDRGGTRFYIKKGSTTMGLHKYWDDLLGTSTSQSVARDLGKELADQYPRSELAELSTKGFPEWALESFGLAKLRAYQNGELKGSNKKPGAPNLPTGYYTTVRFTADRRVVLAGYRLADWIREQIS